MRCYDHVLANHWFHLVIPILSVYKNHTMKSHFTTFVLKIYLIFYWTIEKRHFWVILRHCDNSFKMFLQQKKNHFFPSESFLYWWSLIIDSLGSSIKRDWLIFCSFFSGQFATVYRVLERHTGHEYAAKFIKKKRLETSRRGVAREDIQKEIHILAEMEHANIIYLHQVYENGQNVILVLELWVSEQQFHFYFHHLPLQYSVWKSLKMSHFALIFLLARNDICWVMWESVA